MFSIFRVSQIDQNNDSSPLLLNLLSFGPKNKIMTRLCQRNIAIPCCCSCYAFEKQTILIITMGEIKLLLIFLFLSPQILVLDRLSATVRQWDLCALFNCGCCFRLFPGYFSRCLPNLYIFFLQKSVVLSPNTLSRCPKASTTIWELIRRRGMVFFPPSSAFYPQNCR